MDEHTLPDDPDQWPADPYRLLGVSRGVDERSLKRAYTRLIKRFKPDKFPREFRKLRNAYEFIRDHGLPRIQQNGQDRIILDSVARLWESKAGPAEAEEHAPGDHAPQEKPPPSRKKGVTGRVKNAWEQACAGRIAEAYAELKLASGPEPSPEECLCLYWLLKVAPEVEPPREPCDWLSTSVRAEHIGSPYGVLYKRELEQNFSEPLQSRFERLLTQSTHPRDVFELIEYRWRAKDLTAGNFSGSSAQGTAAALMHDWKQICDRLKQRDETSWCLVLIAAIKHLAWSLDPYAAKCFASLTQQLTEADHLTRQLSYHLDQLDASLFAASEWRQVSELLRRNNASCGELSAGLAAVVRDASIHKPAIVRDRLAHCAGRIALSPHESLEELSQFGHSYPHLVNAFTDLLPPVSSVIRIQSSSTDWQDQFIIRFLTENPWNGYPHLRRLVLSFCIREILPPSAVATALNGDQSRYIPDGPELADTLRHDLALDCAFRSYCLYWAL